MSAYAPRIIAMKINPEKIRDVIGKGGAVIRALTEETGTQIDIQEDGSVKIACTSMEAGELAKKRIEEITAEVEVGKVYEGPVIKLLDFGAIVNVLPGRDGLLHISQIAHERVNAIGDHLKEGQVVTGEDSGGRRKRPPAPVDEGTAGCACTRRLQQAPTNRRVKSSAARFRATPRPIKNAPSGAFFIGFDEHVNQAGFAQKLCHQRLRWPVTTPLISSSRGGVLLISQPGKIDDLVALEPHELPR